ncbi:MAG: hypothetical protein AAF740_02670 [Bacteroidota bacterium]
MKKHFLVFLLIAFCGCQSAYRLSVNKNLDAAYKTSVKDASIAQPEEISTELIRLTPDNTYLKRDEKGRFLMLTWTSWDGYTEKVGQEMTLSREVWATAVPEVKDFCQQVKPKNLDLRLEQLMGLPPENGKTLFVELWVKPEDLFRPCPDPEVSDQTCEVNFPESPYLTLAEEHQKWITELKSNSYGDTNGYPWTQLGYTYDWGNPKSEVGVSEFVIRGGATVNVKAVYKTAVYCE